MSALAMMVFPCQSEKTWKTCAISARQYEKGAFAHLELFPMFRRDRIQFYICLNSAVTFLIRDFTRTLFIVPRLCTRVGRISQMPKFHRGSRKRCKSGVRMHFFEMFKMSISVRHFDYVLVRACISEGDFSNVFIFSIHLYFYN